MGEEEDVFGFLEQEEEVLEEEEDDLGVGGTQRKGAFWGGWVGERWSKWIVGRFC